MHRGGKGETMLYLHGASGACTWLPFMEGLSEHFDLIVPEHPGFGASTTPDWLDTIGDLAYFYLDFLAKLQLQNVHLVGTSLGGWVALEAAVRSTDRLKSLTICGSAGIYVKGIPMGDSFLWPQEERMHHLMWDQKKADDIANAPQSEEEKEIAMKNLFSTSKLVWSPRLHNPSLRKWLHRIDIPTHIVWGKEDALIPANYAGEFQKLIPQSQCSIIEECGHLPHIEKPNEFCRLVVSAIEQPRA